jgi:glycosyltransferase involved in cell wall biosynthesis
VFDAPTALPKMQAASKVIHRIEFGLPETCEADTGRLYVIRGYCFHPRKRTRSLALRVGEREHAIEESEDFRPDLAQQFADRDECGSSVTSGFFTIFEASRDLAGTRPALFLEIALDDGSREQVEIGHVNFVAPAARAAEVPVATLAICLATWNPAPEAFAKQVDTLIAQEFKDWVCIVNDDDSAKPIYAQIREICARDPRFHVFRNPANQGFYRNFETAMSRVPAGTKFVALCDQDDIWYPEKLSACLAAFKAETQLVYCDMRIVHESGEVIAPSYWTTRRNQYRDLDVLMSANTVTGAASVIRADLLSKLLPFPQRIGGAFHDHWIACCAMVGGGIEYVDRPLYDYIQHGGNVIGHCDFTSVPTLRERLAEILAGLRSWNQLRHRLVTLRYMALEIVNQECRRLRLTAETLRARFGAPAADAPGLAPFLPPNPWGIALSMHHFLPRFRRDVTGNAELRLGLSLAIRRLNQYYVRRRALRIVERMRFSGPHGTADRAVGERLLAFAAKIAPLQLNASQTTPRRINLVIPEINFDIFFGGYIGKFNLARKLAEAGYRVRLVVVDWCVGTPERWRTQVQRYDGLAGFFDYVEVANCSDREVKLEVNPADAFIATTWWTAHIADTAMQQLAQSGVRRGFVYLIQEFEPFTFPMGALYALAEQSYTLPHQAIFSTALLEEFFRHNKFGVFASRTGDSDAAVHFENAILKAKVDREVLVARKKRKLLFYSRPEVHAARNMFDVAMLALNRAIAQSAFADEPWEFHGVGSAHGDIEFEAGGTLKMLGKLSLDAYRALLPDYDLGLSLMYTPHPSLVPLEMAAAGMVCVTNTCLNKTADRLTAISSNLVAAEPSIEGVAAALVLAAKRVGDIDARMRGGAVNWASTWDVAFHREFMQRLGSWLGPADRAGT